MDNLEEPMTADELMHALTVARQEIVRLVSDVAMLTAERDAAATPVDAERRAYVEGMACAEDRDFANMLIYHVAVLRAEIARLTAERDSHRSRVGSLRSSVARLADLNASLTAQRDAALREVERHRMTEQEKMVLCSAPGTWTEMNWSRFLSAMRGYLERTEAK
ncbi:MAG: hypothetical protein EBZ62_06250 [Sphingobacteriia bacterium]|nr:hypothetical protein [Sphingobacteriia bacterium]